MLDLATFQHVLDVAILRRFVDRALDQRLGATQKPLTVLKTFAARIQAPIDDVHGRPRTRLAGLFDAHIPFDQPPNLPFGIATPDHPLDKLTVLFLGIAVLLRSERNDG